MESQLNNEYFWNKEPVFIIKKNIMMNIVIFYAVEFKNPQQM